MVNHCRVWMLASLLVFVACSAAGAAERPNILIILTDDKY